MKEIFSLRFSYGECFAISYVVFLLKSNCYITNVLGEVTIQFFLDACLVLECQDVFFS